MIGQKPRLGVGAFLLVRVVYDDEETEEEEVEDARLFGVFYKDGGESGDVLDAGASVGTLFVRHDYDNSLNWGSMQQQLTGGSTTSTASSSAMIAFPVGDLSAKSNKSTPGGVRRRRNILDMTPEQSPLQTADVAYRKDSGPVYIGNENDHDDVGTFFGNEDLDDDLYSPSTSPRYDGGSSRVTNRIVAIKRKTPFLWRMLGFNSDNSMTN